LEEKNLDIEFVPKSSPRHAKNSGELLGDVCVPSGYLSGRIDRRMDPIASVRVLFSVQFYSSQFIDSLHIVQGHKTCFMLEQNIGL
jgi:hypothetical protein